MITATAASLLEPAQFLRGVDIGSRRLANNFAPRLPADTWDVASIPTGSRLEFVSMAAAVELRLETSEHHPLSPPTIPDALSVWREQDFVGLVEIGHNAATVTVPVSPDGATYTIYLPAGLLAYVRALTAVGGAIAPVAQQRRWLAYGDSITQGWSVTDPGRAYPSIAARACGLDVWNLGFAGAARGEIAVAEHIAAAPADVISIAFGTNNWSVIPTGTNHLAAIMQDFLAVIRASHPVTPIIVVSPILRPDAESTPNVIGATLAQLRQALEDAVLEMARTDSKLRLVSGLNLVRADELVDGIHPDDCGHRAIADAVVVAIDDAFAACNASWAASS